MSLAVEVRNLFLSIYHIIKIVIAGLWRFFVAVTKKEKKP